MGDRPTGNPLQGTIEPVTDGVERVFFPDEHPMHLGGVSVYLVGQQDCWIVDTGNGWPGEEDAILAALAGRADRVRGIILTHAHGDHAGGAAGLAGRLGVPVHAAPSSTWGGTFHAIHDGETLPMDGDALTVMATPGHSADSLSLAGPRGAWILVGDTVLGEGTSTISDLGAYLDSLDRLRSLEPDRLLPGHGSVLEDPGRTLLAYRRHRELRTRQVLALLSSHRDEAGLLAAVYPGLAPGLERAALRSLHAHLAYLEESGAIRRVDATTWERT